MLQVDNFARKLLFQTGAVCQVDRMTSFSYLAIEDHIIFLKELILSVFSLLRKKTSYLSLGFDRFIELRRSALAESSIVEVDAFD